MGMGIKAKRRSVKMLMEELKTPMFLNVIGSKHFAVLKVMVSGWGCVFVVTM
jgi:hypothetical protein